MASKKRYPWEYDTGEYSGGYDRQFGKSDIVFDDVMLPVPSDNNIFQDAPSTSQGFWGTLQDYDEKLNSGFNDFMKSNPITRFIDRTAYSAANTLTNGGAVGDNYDTGSKIADTAADFLGTGLSFGMRLPGLDFSTSNAMDKVIGQPVKNALTNLADNYGVNNRIADYGIQALKTGAEFGGYEGLSNAIQGKDVGQGIAEGMGQGMLWGAGGKAVGDLMHLIPGIGKVKVLNDDGKRVTIQDEAGNTHDMNKVIFDNAVQSLDTMNPAYADVNLDSVFKPREIMPKSKVNNTPDNLKQQTDNISLYKGQIDDWQQGKMKSGDLFQLGNTPNALKNIGANELPLIMTQKVMKKITNPDESLGGHGLSTDIVKELPTHLSDPQMIFKSKTQQNSIVALTEMKDSLDRPVITAIQLDVKQDRINVNKISSVYGKNNIEKFIQDHVDIGNVLYSKENRANTNASAIGVQFPKEGINTNSINNIIPQPEIQFNEKNTTNLPTIDLQNHSNSVDFVGGMDINALSRRGENNDLKLFEERVGKKPSQGDYKERQAIVNSFMNSKAIPKEVKDALAKDSSKYKYLQHNNEQAMMKARDVVENNLDSAVGKIKNLKSLEDDADTALAIEIQRKYIENGEYEKARDWSLKVAKLGTKSGQAIQYFSTIKRMTPQWTLNRVSKMIDGAVTDKQREILSNAPEGMIDEIARKNKIPNLSAETTKQIVDMSNKIQEMPEGRAKREAIANLNDIIQREIPVSILDKINSVQTLSMLSGTKTPIRNIIGNTLFKAVDNVKEIPRTLIDMPLSLITKERTATLPMLGDQIRGYKEGMKESFLDLKHNVNTKNITDKFELNRRTTWDKNGNLLNKAMSQAERVNRFMLDDRPAMRAAYEGEMARQRKLAKINGTEFDEMATKEKADLKALHDTFSDDTAISQFVTNIKRNANIVGNSILTGNIGKKLDQATKDEFAKWGVGDLLVKFARVPANIVARQVEYSPISLVTPFINATKDAIKGNKFDQSAFADGLAKGLTGSGIIGIGAMLHDVMTTDVDKNKNKAELNKEAGLGQFKLNLSGLRRMLSGENPEVQKGDKIISYDWANPISVLLAAGASMAKAKDEKTVQKVGKIAGDLIDAMNEGVNSIIQQPMNQGLKTWIQQGDMMGGLSQVIASLPQTFIPSLVNQFRQLTDNTARETYDPNLFKQGINQMKNRIPGLEQQLPQKVDVWGNPKETFQNGTNNLLNVFLNPAINTQYLPTPQTEKALSLYEHTANSEALPKLADKALSVDNKKVRLTPEQYIQMQALMGQGASDIYNAILNEDNSNKLAKDTGKALSSNSQDTKIKVLQDNDLPLPLSVTTDEISRNLYKKTSDEAKSIRTQVKQIKDSDMTFEEQRQKLKELIDDAQNAPVKNPPKPRGRKKISD